jgi:hypothetical protein
MTSKKATAEILPLAFANMAVRYEKAASIVHATKDSHLRDPVYFLYFHAAESALKAFLRSKGNKTEELRKQGGHQLVRLYEECVKLGLTIKGVESLSVTNVITLLDGGNDYQGFRYFTLKSRSVPDLNWASKVVGVLVKEIKEMLVATDPDAGKPPRLVKMQMIFGEPQLSR